jgi:anti-sigma B factor antagonist
VSVEGYPVRWAAGRAIIALPAEIDANNADRVGGELLRVLDERPAVLVVDMTGTSYCASAGIHALFIAARQHAAAAGTRLRVAASTYAVRRLLELMGADQVMDVFPDVDAGLRGLPATSDGQGEDACADGGAQDGQQAGSPVILWLWPH